MCCGMVPIPRCQRREGDGEHVRAHATGDQGHTRTGGGRCRISSARGTLGVYARICCLDHRDYSAAMQSLQEVVVAARVDLSISCACSAVSSGSQLRHQAAASTVDSALYSTGADAQVEHTHDSPTIMTHLSMSGLSVGTYRH